MGIEFPSLRIKMKNRIFIIALLLGVVLLGVNVKGLAVTSVCSDLTPCYMFPGEERTFDFLLQSGAGGDAKVRFEILDDAGGIAQIVGDDEFLVPAGSQNVNAKLKVKIPENAPEGKIVNVVLKFTQIPNNQGQVSLSTSFTLTFPLTVRNLIEAPKDVEKKSEANSLYLLIIAVVLVFFVLIAIVSIVIKHRKNFG